MADDKEQAQVTAPAALEANIPDLKKKEKERKKAGVAWGTGAPGAEPFVGAAGADGAAGVVAEGASGVAGTAAAEGVAILVPGAGASFVARFLATTAGKILAGVAVSLVVGGGGIGIYRSLSAPAAPEGKAVELGAIESTVKIHRKQVGASEYAVTPAGALKAGGTAGKITAAKARPAEAAQAAPPTAEAAKSGENTAAAPNAQARAAPPAQAAAKHKPSLRERLSGMFGQHDIFGGADPFKSSVGAGQGAGKFGGNDIMGDIPKVNVPKFGADKLSTFHAGATKAGKGGRLTQRGLAASGGTRFNNRSSKALAQLRGMAPLVSEMRAGGASATEANSVAATAQFEGARPAGAMAPGGAGMNPGAGSGGGGGGGGRGGGGGFSPNAKPAMSKTAIQTNAKGQVLSIAEVCSQQQINDGWYTDGANCVLDQTQPPHKNATPWQKLHDDDLNMLIAGFSLIWAGVLFMGIASAVADIPVYGTALAEVFGWLALFMCLSAMGLAIGIIANGNEIKNMGGDSQGTNDQVNGSMMLVTLTLLAAAASEAASPGMGPHFESEAYVGIAAIISSIVMYNAVTQGALGSHQKPPPPAKPAPFETSNNPDNIKPSAGNDLEDAAKKAEISVQEKQLNGQKGGSDGVAPAPPGMHYEQGKLAYDYAVGFPPSITDQLAANANKGGKGTGMEPAPKGQHYEGAKLIADYEPAVGQMINANANKGGGDSGLAAAPSGQHYESVGGQTQLVVDYKVTSDQLTQLNSQKGGPNTGLDPAPAGQHYEKVMTPNATQPYQILLVNDYPPSAASDGGNQSGGQSSGGQGSGSGGNQAPPPSKPADKSAAPTR